MRAARYRRPTWLATAAQIQAEQGDAAGARANAQRVLDLVVALRAEDSRNPGQSEVAPHIGSIDRAGEDAKAVLRGLDGG